ncbi:tripartite tricarboxylate transporter TctB family protein [Virgibacillus chiguensis]|uniref:Putative tricarboxylic transport membrane protein n=1 Tax=Virgibacillus chiguensis TaxID=411959 RepID=A0A1M5QPF6_9BACI|nr:tripartite tricarboxylate transporter TctB family protein [Virgibacillus chiguensis]SHH15630.1 putative tricarboxylic transport membrane protein [Virgibacillus chiguensis]
MLKTLNRKIAVLLWCIAILYLFFAYRLPSYAYVPIDSNALPIILGILLLVLSTILFFEKGDVENDKLNINKTDLLKLLGVFLLIVLYASFLESLGFLIVSTFFIFFCSYLLGYRKHVINAVIAILVPLTFYLLFTSALQIRLPQGVMPF